MDHVVKLLQARGHSLDVDWVDRLRYVHATRALAALAVFTFTKNYVGQPVQCWVPNEMSGGWEQYIEQYCLIENTYFTPMNESNIPTRNTREEREMIYYQWVPFILLLLSAALYAPRVAWRSFQKHSGVDLSAMAIELRKAARDLSIAPKQMPINRGFLQRRLAVFLVLHKTISVAVIVVLLALLDHFLGRAFAVRMAGNLIAGRPWQETGVFPRVTFCDVQVRQLGEAVHTYTVQCVLMVNMLNEKIFFGVWWFLFFLSILSIVNILMWAQFLLSSRRRFELVAALFDSRDTSIAPFQLEAFANNVLGVNGAALMRLVAKNASVFETEAVARPILDEYLEAAKRE